MDLKGKACIVTGGAIGIGRAIVEVLLEKGAKGVLLGDVSIKVRYTKQSV